MPPEHRLPVGIEQHLTHDENINIATPRIAPWKTIRVKTESDLGASDYDHVLLIKPKTWAQVPAKSIQHARVLSSNMDVSPKNMILNDLLRCLSAQQLSEFFN